MGMLAVLWLRFFMGVFPFFPFTYDRSGLTVVGSSQSLLFCAFALTSSFWFLQVVRSPPGFGVLRRSCSFFPLQFAISLRDFFLVSSLLLFWSGGLA